MAGGISKYVPLRLNLTNSKWELDMGELEAAITENTKIILINTPHNPTGKVFSAEEIEALADIARRHKHVTIVTDEVFYLQ
jgi:aspartate/methionine/tyrosine aminotransferase